MKLLALDCTDLACSVALSLNGDVVERHIEEPRQHSRRLLELIAELLEPLGSSPAALDAIAWGAGPGSFTGLRIAASVVQGLAYAADLPVVPVSSLHALAASALMADAGEPRSVWAAIDARMGEVYVARFDRDPVRGLQRLDPDRLIPVEQFAAELKSRPPQLLVGSAAKLVELAAETRALPDQQVHARQIVDLALPLFADGAAVPAEQALPVYLRKQSAWKTLDAHGRG